MKELVGRPVLAGLYGGGLLVFGILAVFLAKKYVVYIAWCEGQTIFDGFVFGWFLCFCGFLKLVCGFWRSENR